MYIKNGIFFKNDSYHADIAWFETVLRKGSLKVICCFSRSHSDDFNDVHSQAKISLRQLLANRSYTVTSKFRRRLSAEISCRESPPATSLCDKRYSSFYRNISVRLLPLSAVVNENVNIHNETNADRFLDNATFLE